MDNLHYFDLFKDTPKDAQKTIEGGRLKGFTDISPMWRIKKLTEVFGPCGKGWKYKITNRDIVPVGEQVAIFLGVDLFVKFDNEWSEAIPGEGGDMIAIKESKGLHINDDAVKAALTDAIGNACQRLGMSADIYSKKYGTKYDRPTADIGQVDALKKVISELAVKVAAKQGTTDKEVKRVAINTCRANCETIAGLTAVKKYLEDMLCEK